MALMQFPRLADQIVKKAITSLNLNFIVDFSCSLSGRASAGLGLVTRSWYVRILLGELYVLFNLFEDSVNPSGITLWPSWPYNTRHKSLKQKPFVLNFLPISYIHSSHLCSHSNVPLSFPNVEPRVFWSTEMTAIPNQHWGGGKSHKCFKICDEYCSSQNSFVAES